MSPICKDYSVNSVYEIVVVYSQIHQNTQMHSIGKNIGFVNVKMIGTESNYFF